MGRPLFKAPDGGYYQIVRVTKDSTQSGLQQGPEISVLVEQKVRPEAFPSGLPMSVWSRNYATSGFTLFFINQLKEIRGRFKWQHSIIYLLGSAFILLALSLAYFIYLHFSIVLAIAVFIVLNGTAIFLLRRASSILRGDD